jgi:hypothetical protein
MTRKQHTDRPFNLGEFEAAYGHLDQQMSLATTPRHLCALPRAPSGHGRQTVNPTLRDRHREVDR